MTAPVVSVVMAAYNGAALLPATLASLQAQTLRDWELVVVDDCSTDDTLALLRGQADPRIRAVASDRNGGPVLARNRAVSLARGRFLAALDHDDLCHPTRLAEQVAFLERHPQVVLAGTGAQTLEDGMTGGFDHPATTTPALIGWLLRIENPLVWSTVMIRADAARRLAPFTRPEILYAEDFDLYHRIARLGQVARLDRVLLSYRVHAGGISKKFRTKMRESTALVLAEAHAEAQGEGAADAAQLVTDHLMLRDPVPDRATLHRLGAAIARAQAHYLHTHDVAAEDRRLIRWETARRWARTGRAGLRAGTLTVADLVAVRPDHLGLGYETADALLWSGLVGGARRIAQRMTAA